MWNWKQRLFEELSFVEDKMEIMPLKKARGNEKEAKFKIDTFFFLEIAKKRCFLWRGFFNVTG